MPLIRIEFDADRVSSAEARVLSEQTRDAVIAATGIEDVFVYANSSEVRIKVAPVEIFVQISAQKVGDMDQLFSQIKERLSRWRTQVQFPHPLNLTVIPMQWRFEVGI